MQFTSFTIASILALSSTVLAVPVEVQQVERSTPAPEGTFSRSVNISPDGTVSLSTVSRTFETLISHPRATLTPSQRASSSGGSTGLDIAKVVDGLVSAAITSVKDAQKADIASRQKFTQEVAASVYAQFGNKAVVVCNVGYSMTPAAESVTSTNYGAKLGSDVTFDVVVFTTGTFVRKGNGGYENWAYQMPAAPCEFDGDATIVCT